MSKPQTYIRPEYMSVKTAAKTIDVCERQIYKLIDGIRDEMKNGRYSRYAISGSRVNYYVLVDYNTFREYLNDKNMRKLVPEFNPDEIARVCGSNSKLIDLPSSPERPQNMVNGEAFELMKDLSDMLRVVCKFIGVKDGKN